MSSSTARRATAARIAGNSRGTGGAIFLLSTDAGFARVTRYGGGSSFVGRRYDSNARQMQVLERHKRLDAEEASLLKSMMSDPELLELDRQVKAALLPADAR